MSLVSCYKPLPSKQKVKPSQILDEPSRDKPYSKMVKEDKKLFWIACVKLSVFQYIDILVLLKHTLNTSNSNLT